MSTQKRQQFLQQVQNVMTQAAELAERARVLAQVYEDRRYEKTEAGEVTEGELEVFGVNPDELKIAIQTLQALSELTATNEERRIVMNRWRNV